MKKILISLLLPFSLFSVSLEKQIQSDLAKINHPPLTWTIEHTDILDVAIIGGGMAGNAAAFALQKEKISNIKIFDENPPNEEGAWIKSARMHSLQSGNRWMGPALDIPSLTYQAWYESTYGMQAFEDLHGSCPTHSWHEYLCFYRRVLNLPIENRMQLTSLKLLDHLVELTFNETTTVYARKVVLATGRDGSGRLEIPKFLDEVPKHLYAHAGHPIDLAFFRGKKIAIIGSGSSAFDVAAAALENGASSIDMLIRRSHISQINRFAQFIFPGFANGFHLLSDETRCEFLAAGYRAGGVRPSKAAVERLKDFENIHFHYNTHISRITPHQNALDIHSNHGTTSYDFLVAATGYETNLSYRSELSQIIPHILLWKDRVPLQLLQEFPRLGNFPYLGPHFQFLEAAPTSPSLKNIYCFNYGAFLSHGYITGDVIGISFGATRLAKGIAADFFLEDALYYLEKIKKWENPDFQISDYPYLQQ
jgi:cation diffusion facilitator CzcD-associated flavoprotein CzcO